MRENVNRRVEWRDVELNGVEIIALCGRSGYGKSAVLKLLCRTLHNRGASWVFPRSYKAIRYEPTTTGDCTVVVEYRGCLVGIRTQGDDPVTIFDSIKGFSRRHVRIGVMAVRTCTANGLRSDASEAFDMAQSVLRFNAVRMQIGDRQLRLVSDEQFVVDEILASIDAMIAVA